MLEPVYLHTSNLKTEIMRTWNNPKYKYYFMGGYRHIPSAISNNLIDNCWGDAFASIDKNGEIIGYIEYSKRHGGELIDNFCCMSFKEDYKSAVIFMSDLMKALKDLFTIYNCQTLFFDAIIENPATKHYTRIVERVGGRQIGVAKRARKLEDGKWYDVIYFQVLREDYHRWMRDCVGKGTKLIEEE